MLASTLSIPDYRLASEHPFPAAVRDLQACDQGLTDKGITRIALTGDSAGGNLALVLLSLASAAGSKDAVAPIGADLPSFFPNHGSRPYRRELCHASRSGPVLSYLDTADPKNPLASPLYADLSGLPTVRVHVGDEEVLLDDSMRFVERAVAARADAPGWIYGWECRTDSSLTSVRSTLPAGDQGGWGVSSRGHFRKRLSGDPVVVAEGDGHKETNMAQKPKTVDGSEAAEPIAPQEMPQ